MNHRAAESATSPSSTFLAAFSDSSFAFLSASLASLASRAAFLSSRFFTASTQTWQMLTMAPRPVQGRQRLMPRPLQLSQLPSNCPLPEQVLHGTAFRPGGPRGSRFVPLQARHFATNLPFPWQREQGVDPSPLHGRHTGYFQASWHRGHDLTERPEQHLEAVDRSSALTVEAVLLLGMVVAGLSGTS